MTMDDLGNGGKKGQNPDLIDLSDPSALPPPYDGGDEGGADQSMLDSFKPVSIYPSAPAPDESAVDIRLDDDDVATSIDELQSSQSKSTASDYMTPHRASQQVLQTSLPSACRITGFSKVEMVETAKSNASQRSGSISSGIDGSSASVSTLPVVAPLPPLIATDMVEALPHRYAFFLPDIMEWFVLIPEQQVRMSRLVEDIIWPDHKIPPEVMSILYRIEGELKISVDEQAYPINTLLQSEGDFKLEPIEDFVCWRNTQLESLLTNRRGSLPSVLSLSLLEQFRAERIANPRPGYTGEMQFKEAICMLIKIVGNAANGETRSLSINGKMLTNKLGFDEVSQKILGIIGFSTDGKPDADGKYRFIKPPDMTQKVMQIMMRRAWLEIALWYQYRQSPSSVEAFWKDLSPSIPFQPEFGSVNSFLETAFTPDNTDGQLDSQTDTRFKFARSHISEALQVLGADNDASEEVVEECYLANTVNKSKDEQLPYYSALQVIGEYLATAGGVKELVHTRLAIEKSRGLFTETELKEAYSKIGLECDSLEQAKGIGNDFILSVYVSAVNGVAGNSEEVQARKDALDIISASRNRPVEVEEQLAASVELSIDKAYEILGANKDIDDVFVSSIFSVAITEGGRSGEDCIEALRVIAEDRKSEMLRKLYRSTTGEVEEWQPADLAIPIGLNNIGNTCYLNSVLQYFFAIGKLRDQVVLASREDIDEVKKVTELPVVRVGGRQVTRREIDRSHRFVRQLGQLFSNMTSAPTSAVTPERELAYLALVSSRVEETNEVADVIPDLISMSPEVEASHLTRPTSDLQLDEKIVLERPQIKPKNSDESMLIHESITEEKVVEEVPLINNATERIEGEALSTAEDDGIVTPPLPESKVPPALPPRPKVGAAEAHDAGQRRNSLMQLGAQQDVSECLDNVMFQIEVALTAAEQSIHQATTDGKTESVEMDDGWIEDGDLLRRLFLGRTLQRLELVSPEVDADKSVRGPSIHIKREVFTILPIDVVEEGRDIYDGLDGFFDEEILTGSGGEPIRRTVTLTDAPVIMQIQLQRVQYDRVKGVYKSQAHLETGQTLYMDRYLDFNPLNTEDVVRLEKRRKGREARKRVAELRERLRALEPEKTPMSQTLKQASSFLSSWASFRGKSKQEEGGEDAKEADNNLDGLADLSNFLGEEANRVEEEVKEAQKEILALKSSVEELWKDETRMEYILTSVFMHRGEASHGHYFLNQRKLTPQDHEPSSTWYKYNDQTVTEVTWSDVHRDQSGATPYLLCWIRRDKLDHFDTLCRKYEVDPPASLPEETAPAPVKAEEEVQGKPTADEISTSTQSGPLLIDTSPQIDDTVMADLPDAQ
jgi:ubiquitin carboxyl-terminal hydrolase 25/28